MKINNALEDAVRREEIFRNPAAYVERPKPDEVNIRVLENIEEIGELVQVLNDSILLLPGMVMLTTGLRRVETGVTVERPLVFPRSLIFKPLPKIMYDKSAKESNWFLIYQCLMLSYR